jgi:hypothetical protein
VFYTRKNAEELEDLHTGHLVKTVTKQSGVYEGLPGVSTFVVGQKKVHSRAMDKLGRSGDELEKCPREELLKLLQQATSTKKGSQPKVNKAGADDSDSDEDSSSSNKSGSHLN